MVIRELYLENFGKFSHKHFYIEEGIHVFYGENEYGKSTVYAFIKAMLFGMERGRGRAAQNDGFSRYEPWVNPNYYAGSMRFSIAGKNFFLERKFDRYTKSARLVCEDDGEELSVDDGDLDMLLGKMTAESFENTVAMGQLSAKPGQGLAEELKNYAANYYETGSSNVNLGSALETLRQRRKAAEQQIRSLREMRETKKDTIRQECQYVSEDAGKLQRELEENQKILKSLLDENAEDSGSVAHLRGEHPLSDSLETIPFTGDEAENYEAGQYKNLIAVGGLGTAAGVLGRLWSVFAGRGEVFAGGGAISVLSWVFLGAGLLLLCTGAVKYGKYRVQSSRRRNAGQRVNSRQENTEYDYEKKRQIEENRQKLEWENQRIKAQWKEKQVRFQNLQELLAELEMPDKRIKNLQNWDAALRLAEEKMIEASRNMTQGLGTF